MKIIEPSVERWIQDNMWEHIARCARVCYQSEPKKLETDKDFCERVLFANKHYGMLEHGTVYLRLPVAEAHKYVNNPYSKTSEVFSEESNGEKTFYNTFVYVTTNYRVLIENEWTSDLKDVCEQTEHHAERITLSFIISSGVAREFTRHRKFSFAQESTRYCNYSKDKFGNELIFVRPRWCVINTGNYFINNEKIVEGDGYLGIDKTSIENTFINDLIKVESDYMWLLERGLKPQDAREVLPLATKTQLIMTGFEEDWKHFFDLRCASNAHPDAQYIANKAKELIYGNENSSC